MKVTPIALTFLAASASVEAFWLHRTPSNSLDLTRNTDWLGRRKTVDDDSELSDVYRALRELSTDFTSSASFAKNSLFTPGLHLRSDDVNYVLSMDVPGITRSELEVKVDQGTLTIHGHHPCNKLATTNAVDPMCVERTYDATFTLPSDADSDRAHAALDGGVVKVLVPKVKEGTGAGRVLNLAEDLYESAREKVGSAYDAAAESAYGAYESAANNAKRAYDATANAAETTQEKARRLANEASASAASVASQVSASAASVVGAGQRTVDDATKSAKSAATEVYVSGASAANHATASGKSAASVASASGKSAASAASASAASATSKLAASASSASSAAASAASSAASAASTGVYGTETPEPKKGIYERVKEAVVGSGGTHGDVRVEKEDL